MVSAADITSEVIVDSGQRIKDTVQTDMYLIGEDG
jgi:hypothetical protein